MVGNSFAGETNESWINGRETKEERGFTDAEEKGRRENSCELLNLPDLSRLTTQTWRPSSLALIAL